MDSSSRKGVIFVEEKIGARMENPFTLKVFQVFTGFGIGCGVGIGVGHPLNLGAIPVLNQVMVAARGATNAFSGVQRHVNSSLRKVGAEKIEVGIGCGIGFGHGFGVGIAVKPRLLDEIQTIFIQAGTHLMEKFGIASTLPINQGILAMSTQNGTSIVEDSVSRSSFQANIKNQNTRIPLEETSTPKNVAVNMQDDVEKETSINNFMEDGFVKENRVLLEQVRKHQVLIEELMQETKKLRQILVEELKVEFGELQSSITKSKSPCTECFECRRKQRRR